VPTLADLIQAQKTARGYSYRVLEARANDVITAQRWQQLGTGVRIREFPEPATLQAMADALEVDVASVVLAAARSIGLPVKRSAESDLAAMLPASAALLTDEQRDAILALVRSITRGVSHAASATPPTEPRARGAQAEVEKTRRGVGRRRASVRATRDEVSTVESDTDNVNVSPLNRDDPGSGLDIYQADDVEPDELPAAARQSSGRTKGEQIRDRDAQLGEESQVDPDEE